MQAMQLTPKFLILVVVLVGAFTLIGLDRVAWGDVDWIVSGATLYGLGNGIAVQKGQPIRSAIEAKPNGDHGGD